MVSGNGFLRNHENTKTKLQHDTHYDWRNDDYGLIMKRKLILLITFGTATVLFADYIVPYNKAKAPTLPLPDAYQRAMAALGAVTNQFHCINASVQTSFDPDGEWFFTFYSTNSQPKRKWVTVEFGGKIHVENTIIR
jgi:hypothetical protein